MGTFSAKRAAISLSFAATLWAGGPIDVKVVSSTREHCHIIEFLQGWTTPRLDERGLLLTYNASKDYEFRTIGLLGTRFLVAGVVEPKHMIMDKVEARYTTNKYEIDLSNPKAIAQPASTDTWDSGTTIALSRKSVVSQFAQLTPDYRVDYRGFQFEKSGRDWVYPDYVATRLSPDEVWLVLQSRTGPVDSTSGPEWNYTLHDIFRFYRGKIFFDIFNADTGKKVLTISGNYDSSGPDTFLGKTAWLTERYFIVPMGEHNERCLVCEFGSRSQNEKVKH